MNSVDIIVLVLVLLNGIIGAFRGFTWQAFRIGSLILAFWLGNRFGTSFAEGPLSRVLGWEDATALRVLAWAIILVVTYLVMTGIGLMLKGLIERARLTSSDRSLGFLLGCLKGSLFVAIGFQVLIIFAPVLPGDVKAQLWGDPSRHIAPSQAAVLHRQWLAKKMNSLIPSELGSDVSRGIEDAHGG